MVSHSVTPSNFVSVQNVIVMAPSSYSEGSTGVDPLFGLRFGQVQMNSPCPRTIDFTEEDALPCAQNEIPILYHHPNTRSHQAGLHMAGAVPFRVTIVGLSPWKQTV